MVNLLSLIKARFPGQEVLVDRLFGENPTFRTICRDYSDCLAALERLHGQESDVGSRCRIEYTELLDELRAEIQSWLAG